MSPRQHTGEEYPGTGMGPVIVRRLAEAHGGSVRIEPTAGAGVASIAGLPVEDG